MFKISCCDKKKRCKVYALAHPKMYQSAFMKMCYCTDCRSFIVVIESTDYAGNIKTIRKQNSEARVLYEKNKHNIVYEIKPYKKGKFGWYLKYCDYGKIKRCYSNLRTLKLGIITSDFEDIKFLKKHEFHHNKQTICA